MHLNKRGTNWRRLSAWLFHGSIARLFTVAIVVFIAAAALLQVALAAPEGAAVHRVQSGDTLPRLCWQYKVRPEIIAAANPGVTDPLPIGRRLVIPLGPVAPDSMAGEAAFARKAAPREKAGFARDDAFIAPAVPVRSTERNSPTTPAPVSGDEPVAAPRSRPVAVRPAVAVAVRPAVAASPVARAVPAPPPPRVEMEMAAVSRSAATTILPPRSAVGEDEAAESPTESSAPPKFAIRPVRSAADIPPPPPSPLSRSSTAGAAASASAEDRAEPAPRGGLDFLGESRRLAARGLRYNGHWTPPGQRSEWVMDCSNTSRYLYQAVAGIDIGRTASDQYDFLRRKGRAWDVPMGWDHKPKLGYLRERLRAGDLLFWENTYKPVRKPDITHVMVFLGEDAQGRWQMAGSQTSRGVNIYHFDAQAPKGGYSSWFGLVHHEGRFVAYGRPLE